MQATALRNSELNTLRNVSYVEADLFAGLHVGHPGSPPTGASETTGGSYARQAVTLSAAASGAIENSGALNFTGMPAIGSGAPLVFLCLWDAVTAGVCLWALPLGVQHQVLATAVAATDIFTAPSMTLIDTDMVDLIDVGDSALPTGVSVGTIYFVRDVSGVTFKLALTSGGTAINITADGACLVRRIQPKTTNSGDTFQVAAGALDLAKF